MELYFITDNGENPGIIKKLINKNGIYYGFEYEKNQNKFLKIGVVCKSATRIFVKQDNNIIDLEQSKDGIWHHIQHTWDDGMYGGKTEGIFGFNIGGDFYIQAWDENECLGMSHVAIIPQVFTLEEYRQMKKQVVQMIESFSIDAAKIKENDQIYLKRIQHHLYPLNKLDHLVGEFTAILEEIIEQPGFKLAHESLKKHKQNIKRWTPQLILEESITQKEYLTVQQTIQSFQIEEHQMILAMLKQMKKRMEKESGNEAQYIESLKQDEIKLNLTMENASGKSKVLFTKLNEQIKEDLETLTGRKSIYERLFKKIISYIEEDLFQVDAIPVEETHLFKMDVKYKTIFSLYNDFEIMLNEQVQNLQPFIKSLLKSPTLYEIWIFLKIIEQFKKWGFSSLQFIEWIKNKYRDAEQLIGFDEVIELSDMPFRIRLMFNKYLNNVKLQPDYIIGVQNIKIGNWEWHTLDAKYKVYNDNSVQELFNDINHSAERYYNNIIIEESRIKSSAIVHPNMNVSHWNLRQNAYTPHAISQFFVKPLDTSMLSVYFKRMLHHYGKFADRCPTCNAETVGVKKYDRVNILTYECGNCFEVWVKSHCWSCGVEAGPLYKYAIDNYNFQVENQWNVHCSKCFADANRTFSQDASILQESYIFKGNRPKQNGTYNEKNVPCSRCNGEGKLMEYEHINYGICFKCNGTGIEVKKMENNIKNIYGTINNKPNDLMDFKRNNDPSPKKNTLSIIDDDLPF